MELSSNKPPVWFWIVSVVALLWNGVGVVSYFSIVGMSAEAIAELPAAEQALYVNTPVWATAAFAIAVWGGLLGSALLVLRKAWAVPVLIVSLVGIVVQFGHWLFMTDAAKVYGAETYFMPALVTTIAVILVWFANLSKSKGWLH